MRAGKGDEDTVGTEAEDIRWRQRDGEMKDGDGEYSRVNHRDEGKSLMEKMAEGRRRRRRVQRRGRQGCDGGENEDEH